MSMPASRSTPSIVRPIGRRTLLTVATTGCVLSRAALRAAAEEVHAAPHAAPHWSYEGEAGPAHWGELSPGFRACAVGLEQSPVDLPAETIAALDAAAIAWRPMPLRIVNNGHTIQVHATPGSFATIDGRRYEMQQFHFHHPSEHLLAGKAFDLECHFVHRAASGELAVIGVFVRPGAVNAALQPIWNAMPQHEGPERDAGAAIDPSALLPTERQCFRYMGSLTTPPCTEGIAWTVFRTAIQASPGQIHQFAALFNGNARPAVARTRRFLLSGR
jgi:carbonic anhydrase